VTRLVFLTGPGGAGTTTLAAATAVHAARAGDKVLLLGVADAGELDVVLALSGPGRGRRKNPVDPDHPAVRPSPAGGLRVGARRPGRPAGRTARGSRVLHARRLGDRAGPRAPDISRSA